MIKSAGSAMKPPKIVIEHLEPKLSTWLLLEYENASKIVKKKIWFMNIKDKETQKKLKKLGTIRQQSVLKIFPHEKLVILDPRAKMTLTSEDLKDAIAVVGGILGEYPPHSRTKALLTSKAPKAKTRNLGHEQFTIDGAVYIAKKIIEGKKISAIPTKHGLILRTKLKPSGVYEVELPYAYPVVAGKPVISKKLLHYLTKIKNPKIVWRNRSAR
jgi:ribosome biogenesis SPOUT family RNA methylase Rps3